MPQAKDPATPKSGFCLAFFLWFHNLRHTDLLLWFAKGRLLVHDRRGTFFIAAIRSTPIHHLRPLLAMPLATSAAMHLLPKQRQARLLVERGQPGALPLQSDTISLK